MNINVSEAIENLEEDIAEKKEHIKLLKQFEQLADAGLTEEQYHEFCKTDMRCSDDLGKALLKVFPFLNYEKRGANDFVFSVQEKGYKVAIPSYIGEYIEIWVDKYYQDEKTAIKYINLDMMSDEVRRAKEIQQKEAYFSTHSVFKRAKLIYPYANPVIAFFAYIFSGIGRDRKQEVSHELVSLYKKQKEETDKRDKKIRQAKLDREAQQTVLSKYIPLFLKWTNTVLVYRKGWEREAVETHKRAESEQYNGENYDFGEQNSLAKP